MTYESFYILQDFYISTLNVKPYMTLIYITQIKCKILEFILKHLDIDDMSKFECESQISILKKINDQNSDNYIVNCLNDSDDLLLKLLKLKQYL